MSIKIFVSWRPFATNVSDLLKYHKSYTDAISLDKNTLYILQIVYTVYEVYDKTELKIWDFFFITYHTI